MSLYRDSHLAALVMAILEAGDRASSDGGGTIGTQAYASRASSILRNVNTGVGALEVQRTPIGCSTDRQGMLVVVCDDGSAWFWGQDQARIAELRAEAADVVSFDMERAIGRGPSVRHTWNMYHSAIPGTLADVLTNRPDDEASNDEG
jgi:hypothetical protein